MTPLNLQRRCLFASDSFSLTNLGRRGRIRWVWIPTTIVYVYRGILALSGISDRLAVRGSAMQIVPAGEGYGKELPRISDGLALCGKIV
jgi:hypothetical protein